MDPNRRKKLTEFYLSDLKTLRGKEVKPLKNSKLDKLANLEKLRIIKTLIIKEEIHTVIVGEDPLQARNNYQPTYPKSYRKYWKENIQFKEF
jgi:hypothetical protein